jgi:hypothetical protein
MMPAVHIANRRISRMAHHEEHGGGGWFMTFIITLVLWGGVLGGMIFIGHNLANLASKH